MTTAVVTGVESWEEMGAVLYFSPTSLYTGVNSIALKDPTLQGLITATHKPPLQFLLPGPVW